MSHLVKCFKFSVSNKSRNFKFLVTSVHKGVLTLAVGDVDIDLVNTEISKEDGDEWLSFSFLLLYLLLLIHNVESIVSLLLKPINDLIRTLCQILLCLIWIFIT